MPDLGSRVNSQAPGFPGSSGVVQWAILALSLAAVAVRAEVPVAGVDAPPTRASATVRVPFATNRERIEGVAVDDTYTGNRGATHFGYCEVEFTPLPMIGDLVREVPFHVPKETNSLRLAERADAEDFWDRFAATAEQTSSGNAVLFVHGYNYGFQRTCRMAAELQRSLQGGAAVLMLSWPSNGVATDYIPDQADVEWSVPFIADVMMKLARRVVPANVQVLAHSLGTRGVVFALERLRAERISAPVVGALVLVAPDFDSQVFVERLPELRSMVGRIILYASSSDAALRTSRGLHESPRLGEAGAFLTLAPGLETVDVSPTGRYQILGHEYFHFHPRVRADLALVLREGTPAEGRPGLVRRERDGLRYWEFKRDP